MEEKLPSVRKLRVERKKYERSEVRRFTRRARRRRRIWLAVVGVVIVGSVLGAILVFSPALDLKTISVIGTKRLDATALSGALSDQLGKPLALVDFGQITRELGAFPLIRSYTTVASPPHTLIVSVVERDPIGSVHTATGYQLVDAAAIVVDSSTTRAPALPLISVDKPTLKSEAFRAVVKVLLALPPDLEATVDSITATTNDDVSFVLSGVGQSVVWGSSDRSAYKARVLAALLAAQNPNQKLQYDVSAPDSVVVRKN